MTGLSGAGAKRGASGINELVSLMGLVWKTKNSDYPIVIDSGQKSSNVLQDKKTYAYRKTLTSSI